MGKSHPAQSYHFNPALATRLKQDSAFMEQNAAHYRDSVGQEFRTRALGWVGTSN